MATPRVTLKSLAKELGVTHATVSLALRGHPRIPKETQDRIREHAARRGYIPDPHLAAMASYLRKARKQKGAATLAVIDLFPAELYPSLYNTRVLEGIYRRASALGYGVDLIHMRREGLTAKRLEKVLHSRGISGVIFQSSYHARSHLCLSLAGFASIAICHTLLRPELDRISHSHFSGMRMALKMLESAAYKRIGFYCSTDENQRVQYRWLGAYLAWDAMAKKPVSIPPLIVEQFDDKLVLPWIKKHRIDAVISPRQRLYNLLRKANYIIPDELGYACVDWDKENGGAGVDQEPDRVGERAVDLVVQRLSLHHIGLPKYPATILLPGKWRDGPTIRRTKQYETRLKRIASMADGASDLW